MGNVTHKMTSDEVGDPEIDIEFKGAVPRKGDRVGFPGDDMLWKVVYVEWEYVGGEFCAHVVIDRPKVK